MIKTRYYLLIILLYSCVSFETTDVWDKNEKYKKQVDKYISNKEYINNSRLVKVSEKELEYQIDFALMESISSKYELTYNITKKLFIPCKDIEESTYLHYNSLKKKDGLCGRQLFTLDNKNGEGASYKYKLESYQNLAFASIFIVGLIPSWYSYYKATQEDGMVSTDTKEQIITEDKETKLIPINGHLILGSNLKSREYKINDGILKIPTDEFLSYDYDTLPLLKQTKSNSIAYTSLTKIVIDNIEKDDLPVLLRNQTKEDESEDDKNKALDELKRKFNENVCDKFNRQSLDELGYNILSNIDIFNDPNSEEFKEVERVMLTKEYYCSNFYNELTEKIMIKVLESAFRRIQRR